MESPSPIAEVDSALSVKGPPTRVIVRGDAPVVVDARILRRVIKRDHVLPGIGLDVPHAASYVIAREQLLTLASERDLGVTAASLPSVVVLLPRPEAGASDDDVVHALWRGAFHAAVHVAYDDKRRSGALTQAAFRERVHRLGHCEFVEASAALKQEERMLPARSDGDAWAEFAATFLELRHFAPDLMPRMFSVLGDLDRVDALLADDLDAKALLVATRPDGATDTRPPPAPPESRASGAQTLPTRRDAATRAALLERAQAARARQLGPRGALLDRGRGRRRRGRGGGATRRGGGDGRPRGARRSPSRGALGGDDVGGGRAAWAAAFELLARRAVHGSRMERSVEARALFDVQTACLEGTRTPKTVELAAFVRSLGKKPIVRELPAAREVRVARRLKSASERAIGARLPPASKHEVQELLHGLALAASAHLRGALGPRVEAALVEVGLTPTCAVERVALRSVVAQLLDGVDARGFFSIGQVRDAVSKNALKLPNVTPAQLVKGDAVLRADRRLGEVADGVYREGEIYLRGLQKASSLAFGTKVGRLLTLYVALPFGSSYVALEGVGHLVGAISELLHGPVIELFNPVSFVLLGAFIFVMLHVASARRALLQVLGAIGVGLHAVFVALPRWIAARPLVRRILDSRPFRALARFVVWPGAVAAGAGAAARALGGARAGVITAPIVFVVACAALNSPVGILFEELVSDWVLRRLTWLGRQFLPNLFHLVVSLFSRLIDSIERGLYAVDEWLRFREGEHPAALVGKVVFGFVWFVVAYVVRLYINLLIEPQVNPIKHFPVVTVGAKIIWPMSRKISHASIRRRSSPTSARRWR